MCDPADNKCGLLNGDGACTVANGGTVCRSGVCDPDLKCGYATGDGPCTSANGATVCRSTSCSSNGTCAPLGGCNVDADCTGGQWCQEALHACTPKLVNGTAMPSDAPHTSPTLNGTCTAEAAALVCVSGVCDTADNRCGFANGDGPCSSSNATTVCRSGSCSANGLCKPAGGCLVDTDCSGGQWCNESAQTCTLPIANGGAVPTDPPHTNPTLNGICTTAAGALTCLSGVCDTADNKCGYADGDGPCTAVNGATVCRSASCSANNLCMPAGGCNVDADCTPGNWCNETAHLCTSQLPNGSSLPSDPPHQNPTLNGVCTTAAATLVCTSGVCETSDNACGLLNNDGPCTPATGATICRSGVCDPDNKCGYADGDGPCTSLNGGTVCRSGTCSSNGTCAPAGGCNVDEDCSGGHWCMESTHSCEAKLSNGTSMPTDAPHTDPTLDGTCTQLAAGLVCASAVCDTNDDKCGYANGDGPCTSTNATIVCRSGVCSANGTCMPAGGCNVDADCSTGNWCHVIDNTCTPQLANGTSLPSDPGHTTPVLDGKCTAEAAALVCISGVCDASDDKCGYTNGTGPCDATTGATVCRSTLCATDGANANLCVECLDTSNCSGTKPACDTTTNKCVQCTPTDSFLCIDTTPVCDTTSETCVACNGDFGSNSTDPCPQSANPYCSSTGACTKCTTNTDCTTGQHQGPFCNQTTGVCGNHCSGDGDCQAGYWCDDLTPGSEVCEPKVPNGQAVPGGTCNTTLGSRACVSGVCDTNDNLCGYANGHGPCDGTNGTTVCRSTICVTSGPNNGLCEECATSTTCADTKPVCDSTTNTCTPCNGDQGTSATDSCPTTTEPFCASNGACGKCTSDTDCTSGSHPGPKCNTTSGACYTEPDGGVEAGPDAKPEASPEAAIEAAPEAAPDAVQDAPPDVKDSSKDINSGSDAPVVLPTESPSSLEGGGCSCETAPGHGGVGSLGAGLALALAAALQIRRRK